MHKNNHEIVKARFSRSRFSLFVELLIKKKVEVIILLMHYAQSSPTTEKCSAPGASALKINNINLLTYYDLNMK